MFDALAHYAETNCKDDMTIFLSSGFEAKSTTRSAPAPTATPGIAKVDQGKTGEAVVKINPVLNARSYEIRSGALGSGGPAPVSWGTTPATKVKPGTRVTGLTPARLTFSRSALSPRKAIPNGALR